MKPYILNTLFVILAGTTALVWYSPEGPNCAETLFWFKVKVAVVKSCVQVQQNDLQWVEDSDNDSEPNEVFQGTASTNPFGCTSETTTACAIGYRRNQIERIMVGGANYFRPKLIEVGNYQCCVKRNQDLLVYDIRI